MSFTFKRNFNRARALNDMRTQYRTFHDVFEKFADELVKLKRDEAPAKLANISAVSDILDPDSEDLRVNAVGNLLRLTLATLDVADGIVDIDNFYSDIWVQVKRQTLTPFISVCAESCRNAQCDFDPMAAADISKLKVEDIAADKAKKQDKDKAKEYIEALVKFSRAK